MFETLATRFEQWWRMWKRRRTCASPMSSLLFLETPAAFAGYGFDLCEHFQAMDDCAEDLKNATKINLFTVHYSDAALTTASTPQISAFGVFEPDYRHHENFSLGYAARKKMTSAESYWQAVHDQLKLIIRVFGDLELVFFNRRCHWRPKISTGAAESNCSRESTCFF